MKHTDFHFTDPDFEPFGPNGEFYGVTPTKMPRGSLSLGDYVFIWLCVLALACGAVVAFSMIRG